MHHGISQLPCVKCHSQAAPALTNPQDELHCAAPTLNGIDYSIEMLNNERSVQNGTDVRMPVWQQLGPLLEAFRVLLVPLSVFSQ